MFRKQILLTLILSILPFCAHATNINDEGAQTLKTAFQNLLDYQLNINHAIGGVTVEYEGETTVNQEDGYYTVTLPRMLLKSPNNLKTDEENPTAEILDLGIVTVDAMPAETAHKWKTVFHIPNSFKMAQFSVNFLEPKIVGILDDRLGYFPQIDMQMAGINFTNNGQDIGLSFGKTQFYNNMAEKEDGLYSGPGHFLIENLSISPEKEDETIKIGEVKFDFSADKMRLPTLKEYEAKIINLAKALENETTPKEDFASALWDIYTYDMNGASFAYNFKNIEVTSKSGETPAFKLANATIGANAQGLGQEKGQLSLNIAHDGLIISDAEKSMNDILPKSMNINLNAENIPYAALTKLLQNLSQTAIESPESMEFAGLGLMMQLPTILSQAGTTLTIKNNGLSNDIYNISLNGSIFTEATSMFGFAAKFNALFKGLEPLITIVEAQSSDPEFTSLFTTLKTLKALGNKNEDSSYSYEIETTPQGQLKVNGKDPLAAAMGSEAE